ncbi:MAG: glycosyltransferase family 2 protein, partial [bacterium]|nr:glycosyltransferase family 2 protein [bacterium]
LETVRGLGEIIVVDSGSTDQTLDICRKFGAKVFSKDWSGFGPQKNYAIEQASGTWILSLDADERITPGLKDEIQQAMQSTEYDGYYIARKNYFGRKWIKHCGWYPDYNLRFFRKSKGRFENKNVHERVVIKERIGFFKEPLLHFTYADINDYLQKLEIFTKVRARDMANSGRPLKMFPNIKILAGFLCILARKERDQQVYLEYIRLKEKAKLEINSYLVIPFLPLAKFCMMYIIKKGFLDGFYGLWLSILSAYAELLVYVKFMRLKHSQEITERIT